MPNWIFLTTILLMCIGFSARAAEEKPAPAQIVVPAQPHALRNAQAVAISSDGQLVAAGFGGRSTNRFPLQATDGKLVLWETQTGKKILEIGEYGDFVRIDFTHDKQRLLYSRVFSPGDSIDDNNVTLVDISAGKAVRRGGWGGRYHVFAADPKLNRSAYVLSEGVCSIFDQDLPDPSEAGQTLLIDQARRAQLLGFSPDGAILGMVHEMLEPLVGKDGQINPQIHNVRLAGLAVYETKTWKLMSRTINKDLQTCTALDVDKDGKWLATGHRDGLIRVWSGSTLALMHEWKAWHGAVSPLFSPDGKWLAVLTQSAGKSTWNYTTPDAIQSSDTSCEVILYDTGQFQVARRFHFEDGNFATFSGQRFAFNPRRQAFSPDGQHLLVGCNGAVLIECSTGKIVRQFDAK